MNHYVLGLEHVGRTYNKKTKKSGSLSLKEKLKLKYLKNKATATQRNDVNSTANKVLAVRAGEILMDAEGELLRDDDGQRNGENQKSTELLDKNDQAKRSSQTRKGVNNPAENLSLDRDDGIEGYRDRTLVNDNFSSKFEFNSANKTKLMKKIKIRKKVRKPRKHLAKGIHLATNLRLESALILNLLSSEKFLSMKADETIDFYTFV